MLDVSLASIQQSSVHPGSNAGIGFAVPVDTVNRIVPQLIRQGEITALAWACALETTVFHADSNSLACSLSRSIEAVLRKPLACGAHASMPEGGQSLGILSWPLMATVLRTSNDLFNAMGKRAVGATVKVAVIRGEARLSVSVTLQADVGASARVVKIFIHGSLQGIPPSSRARHCQVNEKSLPDAFPLRKAEGVGIAK